VCRELASAARRAFEQLEVDPRNRSDRQHRLRGPDATTTVTGIAMEQWQIELSASGRLLYAVDDERRTVWLVMASPGHPKRTERVRGR
jgi:hypothetical protein